MKIFDFIILPILVFFVFSFYYAPLNYGSYLEAGWNNNNCKSLPWAFCNKFNNLTKISNSNLIIETTASMKTEKMIGPKGPFLCVQPKQSYCRRSGNKVLVSLISKAAKNLNSIALPIPSKCFVSDIVTKSKNYISLPKKPNCKILDSSHMTRYNYCAWKEDKILLVFDSSRKNYSFLKNKELNLKNDTFDINITDCFSINPLSSQFQFRTVN